MGSMDDWAPPNAKHAQGSVATPTLAAALHGAR
jgi:hypothetical protein